MIVKSWQATFWGVNLNKRKITTDSCQPPSMNTSHGTVYLYMPKFVESCFMRTTLQHCKLRWSSGNFFSYDSTTSVSRPSCHPASKPASQHNSCYLIMIRRCSILFIHIFFYLPFLLHQLLKKYLVVIILSTITIRPLPSKCLLSTA